MLVAIAPRSYRACCKSTTLHRYNEASEAVREVAISWVRILFEDSLGAEVSIDGRSQRVEDVAMNDILEGFDRTEALLTESAH